MRNGDKRDVKAGDPISCLFWSNSVSISCCNHEGEGAQVRIIFQDYSTTGIGHEGAWDNAGYPGGAW